MQADWYPDACQLPGNLQKDLCNQIDGLLARGCCLV